jgi:hypothetical protein
MLVIACDCALKTDAPSAASPGVKPADRTPLVVVFIDNKTSGGRSVHQVPFQTPAYQFFYALQTPAPPIISW